MVFEPFPTFFLKKNEFRTKRGFLDNVKDCQLTGKNVSEAKKTDEKNKDIDKMIKIFSLFPSPREIIDRCTDEETLKAYLKNDIYKNS